MSNPNKTYTCEECGQVVDYPLWPHTCPYVEEMRGGDRENPPEYECNCCRECEARCNMEI